MQLLLRTWPRTRCGLRPGTEDRKMVANLSPSGRDGVKPSFSRFVFIFSFFPGPAAPPVWENSAEKAGLLFQPP